MKKLIFIAAFTLILSFFAHDLIPHNHAKEIFGTGIKAAFHGNDRKLWYLLLLISIVAAANLFKKWKFEREIKKISSVNFLYIRNTVEKVFDPVSQALRRGILNTKLCD